jgi:hypothetical protein
MPKKLERNELEYLRSENKKLKSLNRHLRKDLSRKEKREFIYDDLELKEAELLLAEELEERKILKQTNHCPKCEGDLEVIGGDKIKIYICNDCNYKVSKRGSK